MVPIVLGYTVAHYFSLLALDGQTTWILASNPFGLAGVDLFGTYGNTVDLTAVGPDAIALVQVGAVVLGHVLGVTLAHERALLSARRARASDQLPLVVVMVAVHRGRARPALRLLTPEGPKWPLRPLPGRIPSRTGEFPRVRLQVRARSADAENA